MDDKKQSQDEALEDGVVEPQPENEAQPGADGQESETAEPEKPVIKKAYSQEEVDRLISERTSTIQKETQEHKDRLARIEMERVIREAQQREQQAAEKDRRDIENGYITEDEAKERKRLRDELNQLQETVKQQRTIGESQAKILAAQKMCEDYGKEYGVQIKPDVLLTDPSLTSPYLMEKKLSEMVIKAIREEAHKSNKETFDRGPGDGGIPSDIFTGSATQEQLDDDVYWTKNKDAILKAQREGKLKIIK
jgi:hypothetical protein